MVSCSAKHVETTEVPKEAPAVVAPTAEPTPDTVVEYTVKKHDTLWDIAGRSSMYGDSFQWPLIFKSNRDKIQDPDLIYPKQNFEIHKNIAVEQVKEARSLSSKTPKYKKHSKPSSKLPVDYF